MPAVSPAPGPNGRDRIIVALAIVAAVIETVVRPDLVWRPVAFALAIGVALTLPWRRCRPRAVALAAFGAVIVVQLASIAAGLGRPISLASGIVLLLIPYAAARWGSGKDFAVTVGLMIVLFSLGAGRDYRNLGDALLELTILTLPLVVGLAVRFRASSRSREMEAVRLAERESLAREMHDTVAHHVSAMVLQAQGGRVAGARDPQVALDALRVIETEGSQALTEMRALVGLLRSGEAAQTAPIKSAADIESLARPTGTPVVTVTLAGDLDGLHPSVSAALFRIAQESVTNAVRHAAAASTVAVNVVGDGESVRLTVHDDGVSSDQGSGYGIIGMTERATMLGGTLVAGREPVRGWKVEAWLPKSGRAA
jgi:signal transduction histidine kinase